MVWALHLNPPYNSENSIFNFISVFPTMAQSQKFNPWINSDRGRMPDNETGVEKNLKGFNKQERQNVSRKRRDVASNINIQCKCTNENGMFTRGVIQ
jgi:hypothetical protein